MRREALEETGLQLTSLKQWCMFSSPGRDPRGHTAARVRARNGVAFHYVASDELATALKAKNPQRVLVIAHGWMNDTKSARDFTSQFVRAALTRAARDQGPAPSPAFGAWHMNPWHRS